MMGNAAKLEQSYLGQEKGGGRDEPGPTANWGSPFINLELEGRRKELFPAPLLESD